MAFDQLVIKDSTGQFLELLMRDSSNGQGKTGLNNTNVTCYYIREGSATNTQVNLVAGSLGTYLSSSWVAVDAVNSPGLYQFCVPSSAYATGSNAVTFYFKATGTISKSLRVVLLDVDLRNATSLGLTNLDAQVSTRTSAADVTTALTNMDIAIGADVTSVITQGNSAWVTATGFSTPADLTSTITTMDIAVGSDFATLETRLSAARAGYLDKLNVTGTLANSDDANTYKATGFSTPADVSGYTDSIITQGNSAWATATGFTVPSDITAALTGMNISTLSNLDVSSITNAVLTLFGTAKTTDFATLETRLSAARAGYLDKLNVTGTLANSDDANTYKATGFSTPADVSGYTDSIITQGDANWATAVGFSSPADITTAINELAVARTSDVTSLVIPTISDISGVTSGVLTLYGTAKTSDITSGLSTYGVVTTNDLTSEIGNLNLTISSSDISSIADSVGVTVLDTTEFKSVVAMARGKIEKLSTNTYRFYDSDSTTVLFTLQTIDGNRTVVN